MNSLPSPHGLMHAFILATLHHGRHNRKQGRLLAFKEILVRWEKMAEREKHARLAQSGHGEGRSAKDTIWEDSGHFPGKGKPKIRSDRLIDSRWIKTNLEGDTGVGWG